MADSKKKNDKELSYKELVAKRDELKREYMDLRFKMVISHVDNPMQKRREIRLNNFHATLLSVFPRDASCHNRE